YRPGPMELIPDFVKRKKGLTKIKYEHPLLEEVCAETYGVMIYQEQVMAAASLLAGYSLGQADLLRRAMGKKDREKMAKERETFISGCAETNGIKEKKANAIFDLLEKFAGYGFNKSHSAAYGLISYQTAYLKANYPVEFMAGLLSNEINNTEKISIFVGECKRMGIPILPPDVNRSDLKFTPEAPAGRSACVSLAIGQKRTSEDACATSGDRAMGDRVTDGPATATTAIRYGLAAIKNVGQGAMEAAIRERETAGEFNSLEDFCRRLDSRIANRKMLESLVKAGAFDFLGRERADLFSCVEEALASASSAHRDRASGQVSLFDDLPPPAPKSGARAVAPWSQHDTMSYEKELLGFYVTGHPLDAYASAIAAGNFQTIVSLGELADRASFRIAGALTQVDKKFTKKEGKPFAVVWLEDLTGALEVVIWNEVYVAVSDALAAGKVIAIQGTLDKRDETVRATAQKVKPLQPLAATNGAAVVPQGEASALILRFPLSATPEDLREAHQVLLRSPGSSPVQLLLERGNGEVVRVNAGDGLQVAATAELKQQLARWL
ncbi:MAG: DNA polymerase III subunit alpha, partial [Verrucomicrobiota bacterium]|nr:DNA polymerase III subunit alpha [Verrucomicrobiota bacterium]